MSTMEVPEELTSTAPEADLEEVSFDDINSDILHIDGDIILYRPCCVLNDDSDYDRSKIAEIIENQIADMMREAGCSSYRIFLTTNTNFRDHLVDDYKANRKDVERPINLKWAKKWAVANLEAVYHPYLEADDLLGIWHGDNTVIWSLDKDLRQIPGKHLDDSTRKVITVSALGKIQDHGKKVYFDGECGFYLQLLTGDSADYIVGCGKREASVFKSGARKGESRVSRKGVGPKKALEIIREAVLSVISLSDSVKLATVHAAVAREYQEVFGDEWQTQMETQANLLFMIREQHGNVVKQWTFDGRDQYFDIVNGVVLHDWTPPTTD